jgi:hypothetical protein
MLLALDHYRLLGRSGLRVSPLALGTMTFGEIWGADEKESRRMFDHYVALGGNFVDTAGYYAEGKSEELRQARGPPPDQNQVHPPRRKRLGIGFAKAVRPAKHHSPFCVVDFLQL